MTETKLCEKPNLPIFKVPIWKIEWMPAMEGSIQGRRGWTYLIEAENKTKARKKLSESPHFWTNYNQATPEERENLTPFKLRKGAAEEIPSCELRYKNKAGDYVCGEVTGEFVEDGISGKWGMCVIEGYDAPEIEECPYHQKPTTELQFGFEKVERKSSYEIKGNKLTLETQYHNDIALALSNMIKDINKRGKSFGRKIISGNLELEVEE